MSGGPRSESIYYIRVATVAGRREKTLAIERHNALGEQDFVFYQRRYLRCLRYPRDEVKCGLFFLPTLYEQVYYNFVIPKAIPCCTWNPLYFNSSIFVLIVNVSSTSPNHLPHIVTTPVSLSYVNSSRHLVACNVVLLAVAVVSESLEYEAISI